METPGLRVGSYLFGGDGERSVVEVGVKGGVKGVAEGGDQEQDPLEELQCPLVICPPRPLQCSEPALPSVNVGAALGLSLGDWIELAISAAVGDSASIRIARQY